MYSIHNQWTRRYAKRVLGGLILALFMTAGCAMTENRIKKEREADSHYKLGMAHLNENNLQMAFIEFQKAIEFNPGDKTYYYAIGIVDFKMDRLEDAIDAYKKALTIDPVYARPTMAWAPYTENSANGMMRSMSIKRPLRTVSIPPPSGSTII